MAKFVEDIIVPPRMVDIIVDGEVFCHLAFYFTVNIQLLLDRLQQFTLSVTCYDFYPQVNEEYLRTLEVLSNKLKFVEVDTMVKTSKALKDVQPELERLRQKAVSKVIVYSSFKI